MPQPPQSDRICHLEPADVERLLRACRDPREEAVISVCLDAGLRISELASLTVADVAVDDIRARHLVVRGKGGKVRGTVIGAATATMLRRYLRERARSRHAGQPALWLGQQGAMTDSGLSKLIRAVGGRAGLEVHPHLLRHTWAHYPTRARSCIDATFGTSREHALPAAQRAALRRPGPAGSPCGYGDLGLHDPAWI